MEDFKGRLMGATLVEKIYLAGFVVGIISLFFTWVDVFIKYNGFQEDGYLFLILMLYPIATICIGQKRQRVIGIILSAINLLGVMLFVHSKSREFFGASISVASTGAYIMVIATIIVLVGAIMEFRNTKIIA